MFVSVLLFLSYFIQLHTCAQNQVRQKQEAGFVAVQHSFPDYILWSHFGTKVEHAGSCRQVLAHCARTATKGTDEVRRLFQFGSSYPPRTRAAFC